MSSNSVIDKKREEINNQSGPTNKQLELVKKMATQLVHLGFIIIIGTCALYTCRAVQANLLPTLIDCVPYTSVVSKFSSDYVKTNVNIVGGDASTKMEFPILENIDLMTNHSLFTWLRSCVEGEKSSNFSLYFSSIMQSILVFNFSAISRVYQMFNSFLPETVIILLLPYVVSFIYFALAFLDGIYFMYLWFAKLPVFCYKKEDGGKWDKNAGSIWSFWNWWKIFVAVILMLFGFSTFISIPFIIVAIAYTFFFPLTLKTQVQSDEDAVPRKYGIVSLLKDVLKFKRHIFMYIISFLLLNNTASLFGAAEATSVVIVCLALFFFTGIYHQYQPTAADGVTKGLASFEQTEKTCGDQNQVVIHDKTFQPEKNPPKVDNNQRFSEEPANQNKVQEQTMKNQKKINEIDHREVLKYGIPNPNSRKSSIDHQAIPKTTIINDGNSSRDLNTLQNKSSPTTNSFVTQSAGGNWKNRSRKSRT